MSAVYHVEEPFTVKLEYEIDGVSRQRLLSTDQFNVAYDNTTPNSPAKETPRLGVYQVPRSGIVVLGNPHDGAESMAFTFGTVYVMNRDGKTVAKYKLADRPDYEEAQGDKAPKTVHHTPGR